VNWKSKTFSVFCIATVCVIFPSSYLYSDYDVMLEADFIGDGVKFEAADLENLLVDKPKSPDFAPNAVSIVCPMGFDIVEQSTNSYLPLAMPHQMTSPLRC
jgi:hypothetical protein